MKRVGGKKRKRLAREGMREALLQARSTATDPGLRAAYPDLPKAPIRLISCPLYHEVNHGGVLRAAESCRIELVQLEAHQRSSIDMVGAVGTADWQPFEWVDHVEALNRAKKDGYTIYGLSLQEGSVPIGEVDWDFPCAIVLGEERYGLSPEAAALCDHYIGIPMYGAITSINVAQAAAVAMHFCIESYRQSHPDFQPARNASRRLVGLPDAIYAEPTEISETNPSEPKGKAADDPADTPPE